MSGSFPLDAYLGRIGYAGPRAATLETLSGIHERHAQAIPFENIDVLLGRTVALDLPTLASKLIDARRGGYCFEQNGLLAAALRALGFAVTPLLARVRWQVPPDVTTPLTHMALRVEIDGRPWLADAGFGGTGLMTPLTLDRTGEQHTRYEPRRLVPHGRNLLQQVRLGATWSDVYILHLDEAFPVDFEVANWFTSSHATSRFRHNLMVACADGTRRLTLWNREFTIRQVDGTAEKQIVASPEQLLRLLRQTFGLNLSDDMLPACAGLAWS